jgi:hypothetical protein
VSTVDSTGVHLGGAQRGQHGRFPTGGQVVGAGQSGLDAVKEPFGDARDERFGQTRADLGRGAGPLGNTDHDLPPHRRPRLRIDGIQIAEGDKLVLFYSSANRGETAIERAHELDLSRQPNPHISFGGGGIHHCLGNQLARFQIRALLIELLTRCPDIVAGEPELSPGNFLHVVKRMPCKPFAN